MYLKSSKFLTLIILLKCNIHVVALNLAVNMPSDKSTIIIKSFLFLNKNICCVYSKEPSFFWASNTYVLIDG